GILPAGDNLSTIRARAFAKVRHCKPGGRQDREAGPCPKEGKRGQHPKDLRRALSDDIQVSAQVKLLPNMFGSFLSIKIIMIESNFYHWQKEKKTAVMSSCYGKKGNKGS